MKKKIISQGFLVLVVIFVVAIGVPQIFFYNYLKKQKEADKAQFNLIISGKLPESLRCVKEIKINDQQLLILLNNSDFRYDKKISDNPIIFKSNNDSFTIIYDSCTYSNNESYYKESLALKHFDGKNAVFMATATYTGNAQSPFHDKEFTVNDHSLSVPK